MKKLHSKKGFTLMEMLIVVAIIAILVAIAIPTFSSSLTKAKQAADNANVRAAYSEAMTEYMLDPSGEGKGEAGEMQAVYDGTAIGDLDDIGWNEGDSVTITVSTDEDGKISVVLTAE